MTENNNPEHVERRPTKLTPPQGVKFSDSSAVLPSADPIRQRRQPRLAIGAIQQRLAQILQHRRLGDLRQHRRAVRRHRVAKAAAH